MDINTVIIIIPCINIAISIVCNLSNLFTNTITDVFGLGFED